MPKKIKKIELDINKKDRSMKFFAKQYEDICVEVAITDGGTIVDFTNCIIEWHSDLEGVPIINTKGNKIELILNASNLKKVGMCTAELVIKDDDGTIKTPNFYFYINKMKIINANNINTISVDFFPLDGLTAQLLIENSQGTDSIEATSIENNKISFIFTNKYTRYSGTGRMQIRLTDEDGCELKLPEFEYEVKNTINENLDNTIPETIMRTLTTEDNKLLLSEDGKLLIY